VFWLWSDGTVASGTMGGIGPVTKTFANPGVYGFTQRMYSSMVIGCYYQEYFPNTIIVHGSSADFSFTQSGLCVPFTAQFTDLSVGAVSWLWDFGNGITSTEQNPLMNFTTMPGDSVTLTTVNAFGCSAQAKKLGLARFQAQASAAYVGACNPLPVQFSASMDDNIDWQWHFGDGTTGTGSNPSHIYTQNGNFDAYVIVTSSANCRDTAHLVVPINVIGPVANFSSPTPANCFGYQK
jgi:PKD repeat protein